MTNKLNIRFIIVIGIFLFLAAVLSFIAYWAVEEGNDSEFLNVAGNLAFIFRFPSHTLLWGFMTSGSGTRFIVTFLFGLIFNILFYAVCIERLLFLFKGQGNK